MLRWYACKRCGYLIVEVAAVSTKDALKELPLDALFVDDVFREGGIERVVAANNDVSFLTENVSYLDRDLQVGWRELEFEMPSRTGLPEGADCAHNDEPNVQAPAPIEHIGEGKGSWLK